MYVQNLDPLGSMVLSALAALVPLILLLVLLGVLRWRAHWAALAAAAVAAGEAVLLNGMPFGVTLNAAVLGMVTAVLYGVWIVLNPIWIYRLTVRSGHFEVLRRSFDRLSDDRRVQALTIAFSFGALIEALGGGGSPVAVCSVMLIAAGFKPLQAAAIALLADTAPVAFGALGGPIGVLAQVTSQDPATLGAMVGRQTPFLAVIVPFILLVMADGRRGLREAWPIALVSGVSFAVTQFVFSNFLSFRLCDIAAAVISAACTVAYARLRPARASTPGGAAASGETGVGETADGRSGDSPAGRSAAGGSPAGGRSSVATAVASDTRGDVVRAWAPYAVIVAIFSVAQIGPVNALLDAATQEIPWPGLHITTPDGAAVATVFTANWLTSSGTLLFFSGLLSCVILGISARGAVAAYAETFRQFGWAALTIVLLFALAYVMNLSGLTVTIALWLATTGTAFAFLSPAVGWLGVTLTGSDASSNALFGYLQVVTAKAAGLDPVVLAAANASGGVLAKMIAPQSLAIAAASIGVDRAESALFRRLLPLSLVLLLLMCLLVLAQATPLLAWMRV